MKNQKNKVIAMRLTPEDNQFIEEQAEKERLTKSSWMRRQIFLKQDIIYQKEDLKEQSEKHLKKLENFLLCCCKGNWRI